VSLVASEHLKSELLNRPARNSRSPASPNAACRCVEKLEFAKSTRPRAKTGRDGRQYSPPQGWRSCRHCRICRPSVSPSFSFSHSHNHWRQRGIFCCFSPFLSGRRVLKESGHLANARNLITTRFLVVGQGGGVLKIRGGRFADPFLPPHPMPQIPNRGQEYRVSMDTIFQESW
jgi:hypothetical protein